MIQSYDLEERTAKFGENIVIFCKANNSNQPSRQLINQLIRSGTSIGANYAEANNGSSRKDFRNKIYIAKKETQETLHWPRMCAVYFPESNNTIEVLRRECYELVLIFHKIAQSTNANSKK